MHLAILTCSNICEGRQEFSELFTQYSARKGRENPQYHSFMIQRSATENRPDGKKETGDIVEHVGQGVRNLIKDTCLLSLNRNY
ncbi:hypothetical protein RRG08_009654 [Elysia crispata]|uniref:Uncharacterized protein n=1 Tax=Elysia crispata TaxID=231223 RepID=A0AAE0ZVL2_9GAST|nr:hypothetical protein RRG08_009654 [Elysia crispata]